MSILVGLLGILNITYEIVLFVVSCEPGFRNRIRKVSDIDVIFLFLSCYGGNELTVCCRLDWAENDVDAGTRTAPHPWGTHLGMLYFSPCVAGSSASDSAAWCGWGLR